MTDQLTTFPLPAIFPAGSLRITDRNGEPWFIAPDVCRALEHSDVSMAVSRLDEDEKATTSIAWVSPSGIEQKRTVNIISEAGLYSLIMTSRSPHARTFKRWVTHDVLPSIRKHGGYIAGQETMTEAQIMAQAVLVAQRVIAEKAAEVERPLCVPDIHPSRPQGPHEAR